MLPPATRSRRATRTWLALACACACACVTLPGPVARAADWPQWRGPQRDAQLVGEKLPESWPAEPRVLFRTAMGEGHAGPVVARGTLVVLDNLGGEETAHALDAKTGRSLWTRGFAELYADEFGSGPRCTPLIDEDRLYVQSCRGEFRCLNLADGSTRWRFHFSDYGMVWIPDRNGGSGAASRRGNSGAPVIDGDRLIVQIGSADGACLAAFDKRTGALLWKSQNDLTSYSSLALGTLAGRRQVISATCEGLLALDVRDGAVLWRQPFKTRANRNVVTPMIEGGDVAFAACSIPLNRQHLRREGERFQLEGAWTNRALTINLVTPTRAGNHLYGIGAERSGKYICVDWRTGELAWSRSGFGEVASTISDGERLLVVTENGECLLLAADPAKYRELGRFQALGKTFAHPAYAHGVLYVRDARELVAYALGDRAR